jgi:hypothetical protein
MFKDVNDDGFEDVLTLTRYMPVTGPKADQVFNQAALYLSQGGKSFELAEAGETSRQAEAHPPRSGQLGPQALSNPRL